ncbi:MAG: IS66 family transposase [Magnetococcales bacterium]|nr:IS66 family transposase [Magnetococcales bacterium]
MDTCSDISSFDLPTDASALRELVISLRAQEQFLLAEKKQLERHAEFLQGQLNILMARRFGRSSEKHDPRQLGLFDEAETIQATAPVDTEEQDAPPVGQEVSPSRKPVRKKRGRRPLPDWLPRVEIIHELPESERKCDLDDELLCEIGREVSEQLDIIPAKVRVIRHVQIKYGCPHCHQGVKQASQPRRLIPKMLATAALLAHVVVSKYADGIPLYRQSGILVRAGIDLPRNTLANMAIKAGQAVQPLINLMRDFILDTGLIQMDETTIQVLHESARPATSKSYMWVQCGGTTEARVVLFDYHASRGGAVPKELLSGFKGYLQTDGYDGYLAVGADPGIVHVGCFAHARRKFDEVIKSLGKIKDRKPGKADEALAFIGQLYGIEKELREANADPTTRHEVRKTRAGPILDALKSWADQAILTVPPKTILGGALGYLVTQWPRLIRYLDDGRLEIDNNRVENAIRPFVVGRKGWLFSNSVRGAKASANLYSLIETAKANGLEPFAYLRHLFTKLPTAETVDDFESLLPWKVDQTALSTP